MHTGTTGDDIVCVTSICGKKKKLDFSFSLSISLSLSSEITRAEKLHKKITI